MGKCILCNAKATINAQDNASRTIYNCQNCGVYVMSDLAVPQATRHGCKLAAYFTNRKLAGRNEVVLVSFDKAKKDKDYLQLTVEQILSHFPKSFLEQMNLVLMNLTEMSSYEGEEIKVENLDIFPVFYVKKASYDALSFVIKSMQKLDLIEVNYYGSSFFPCGLIVSPKGWDRISRLRSGQISLDTTLILGSGKEDERDNLFRSVAGKAARECGYHAVEARTASSNEMINYELISQIKQSRFLITDLSRAGGGSYFAAGMANALNKTNILTCYAGGMKKIEMDTEQISVLSWKDEDELYLQIFNAIRALVL